VLLQVNKLAWYQYVEAEAHERQLAITVQLSYMILVVIVSVTQ
jgi:hypothetical protein